MKKLLIGFFALCLFAACATSEPTTDAKTDKKSSVQEEPAEEVMEEM